MKIGIDLGHGCAYDGGAVGIRKEEDCINEVGRKVIDKLKALGHEVIECRPSNANSLTDSLVKRCYTVNMANVELFVCLHFNIGGGHGAEVYAISNKAIVYAQKVLNEIVALGYTNRGVKSANFYVLKNTVAPAILIECGFLDSQEDMNRYNAEDYANAIVKALTGQTVAVNPIIEKKVYQVKNIVVYGNAVDKRAAEYLADFLKCSTIDGNIEYDYSNIENVYCVGGEPNLKWTAYAKQIIKGTTRFDTIKEVLKFMEV